MQVQFKNRTILRKKFGKNLLVGGAVPLLLNRVIRTAERLGGSIGSNRIVGIVSPSPDRNNSQVIGGDLLNTISFALKSPKSRPTLNSYFRTNLKYFLSRGYIQYGR